MAATLAALVFTALFCAGAAADLKDLHVKFSTSPDDGFYSMPTTVAESSPEYVKMAHDPEFNVDLYSYPQDSRVSIMFDTYGNIAGLRTAYIKADVGKRAQSKGLTFPNSYYSQPMFSSATYWGKDVWYTSVLFTSPAKLKAGGRKDTGGLVAEDVYLKVGKSWTKISKDECQVEAQGFTKQECFEAMGMHYFHEMTTSAVCETLQGMFLLYESGELMGVGFNPFGSFTSTNRTWFEDTPVRGIEATIPNRPSCLTEWVSMYGVATFHIYFKPSPRSTYCKAPWQISNRCQK